MFLALLEGYSSRQMKVTIFNRENGGHPRNAYSHAAASVGHKLTPVSLLATAALLLFLPGCSRRKSTPVADNYEQNGPLVSPPDLTRLPGTVFDVKYSQNTAVIEPGKFIHALRSVSADHTIYIFDRASEVAQSLRPGKIMFVPGLTLQKVLGVKEDGPDLIVGASDALLTEAIENGKIRWEYSVDFRKTREQWKSARKNLTARQTHQLNWFIPSVVPSVWAATEDSADSKSGEKEGWEYALSARPDSGGLNFELHLKHKGEALTAAIDADGYIQNFRNLTSILIRNSQLESFSFQNQNFNGYVNVRWAVGKGTSLEVTGDERLRLPTTFSVPLFIGGIPFSLELSEALLFKPGFTSKNEIARGAFKVQFSGADGFKISSTGIGNDSDAKGASSIEDHGGIAAVAPFAVLVAVAAPRIELKTGPEEVFEELSHLVPTILADRLASAAAALEKTAFGHWAVEQANDVIKAQGAAYVQFVLSTSATIGSATALIPCQRTLLIATGMGGASFQLVAEKDVSVKFFEEQKEITLPSPQACR